jgi:hypothetical protein
MVGKTPAGHFCYYLYGVERVGRACGYKYFGKQDWYKIGTLTLMKRQRKDSGAWPGHLSETGFALLFMARGRYPVLFNKLDFGSDWNNRPRDMANLTRWMSRNYEQDFNWQNVNFQVDPYEWQDAPILYISGAKPIKFTDEQIKKLRTYVYQGGTIFSCTECNGTGFKNGIREVYRKAFPRYELVKMEPDNYIYSNHAKLDGKPELYVLSNGVRPLAIHTDEDIAKTWQTRAYATKKNSFLFGVNLSRYIAGQYDTMLPRGKTYWPYAVDTKKMEKAQVVRVRYNGNFNPEPLALEALSRRLAWDEGVALEHSILPIAQLGGCKAKVAVMTGTGGVTLQAAEKNAIKAYVNGGGTLVIDGAGGDKKFYLSMHQALRDIFSAAALRPLSPAEKFFTRPSTPIKQVSYRPATRRRTDSSAVRLEAVSINKRPAVVLSREDLTAGMLGFHSGTVDGYKHKSAYAILRNIIMTATGRYEVARAEVVKALPKGAKNIAKNGTPTSPDGINIEGGKNNEKAAIDGKDNTYWDEEDNKKLYIFKLEFKQPKTIGAISIKGYKHQDHSPKDFKIFIDNKEVGEIKNAKYEKNLLIIKIGTKTGKAVELRITGYYGKSPGIAELGVYEVPAQK